MGRWCLRTTVSFILQAFIWSMFELVCVRNSPQDALRWILIDWLDQYSVLEGVVWLWGHPRPFYRQWSCICVLLKKNGSQMFFVFVITILWQFCSLWLFITFENVLKKPSHMPAHIFSLISSSSFSLSLKMTEVCRAKSVCVFLHWPESQFSLAFRQKETLCQR